MVVRIRVYWGDISDSGGCSMRVSERDGRKLFAWRSRTVVGGSDSWSIVSTEGVD